MKKIVLSILTLALLLIAVPSPSYASEGLDYFEITQNSITPIPCGRSESRSCPRQMNEIYETLGETCSESFEEFQQYPTTQHFWVEDPEITAQGKSNERARQFIYWAINSQAIDNHPVLGQIWQTTSGVAFFFVVIVAAFFGIGIIVSRRANFDLNLKIWPTIIKLGVMLLYIALSASIILLLIQLSEIMMRFFIENLGGRDLFNIYFSNSGNLGSSERNYIDFVGCRDLNLRVQESVDTKLMLYQITNITYYIMGIMILLRKILLWFLLFVSPFLALLMPFVFIRNVGWIWIGVFFQWLMYGPLFALFLGALSKIWQAGIPFTFDFSRVNDPNLTGYTYPTAINILYGGPAQIQSAVGDRKLSAYNSGSYVDTFAEYIITLIMLWAVTFFPWWLLRIFRDYCCDGIYAMKNVLFAMYDQMRETPPKGPQTPFPKFPDLKTALKIPNDIKIDTKNQTERKIRIKLESADEIRRASTTEISRAMDMRVTKLTDIAKLETNQQSAQALRQKLALLSNPAQAQTSADRTQFTNVRTELFNRAIKQDALARTILASTSASSYERAKVRSELMKDISAIRNALRSATSSTSASEAHSSRQAVKVTLSSESMNKISQIANLSNQQTKQVMDEYSKSTERSMTKAVQRISQQMNISAEKVRTAIQETNKIQMKKANTVMSKYMARMQQSNKLLEVIAKRSGLKKDEIRTIVKAYTESMDKPANQVVNNIAKTTNISEAKVKGAMQQMGTMFFTKNLVLDFAEENKLTTVQVEAALSKASGTTSGENPDINGPQGGPPEQPTETAKEVEVAATTASGAKEAEAGSQVGVGGGPGPQPIAEEKVLAEQFAAQALKNEQFIEQSGIKPPQRIEEKAAVVRTIIHMANEDVVAANEVVQEVAKEEQVTEQEATELVQEQLEIAADPEKNIEKIVEVPKSISIEEYEELKEMWSQQYEEGEIPVQDNITTREEWVEQDIVTITNVMNKILSPNEDLQQQGLDELGFIIPIFMINNLKGEQLVTYLKAKLEAAKATKKLLDKEKEIKAKLKKEEEDDEENLVELKKDTTKAQENTLHMELENPDKDKTIEEIGERNTEVTVPKQVDEVNPAYLEDNNTEKQQ